MRGLAVRVTLIVDAEAEARARAIAEACLARTGLEAVFRSCAPYNKIGPHSRLFYLLFLPPDLDGQGLVDAVEAIAGAAVSSEALMKGYLNSFLQDDGSLVYNRIFDARTDAFLAPGVLWLDIEVETNLKAQDDLREGLAGG